MTASLEDHEALATSLTNQPPKDATVIARFESMRVPAKELGHTILDLCPPCRERSLAVTKLEEAVMWATKAIALHQDET